MKNLIEKIRIWFDIKLYRLRTKRFLNKEFNNKRLTISNLHIASSLIMRFGFKCYPTEPFTIQVLEESTSLMHLQLRGTEFENPQYMIIDIYNIVGSNIITIDVHKINILDDTNHRTITVNFTFEREISFDCITNKAISEDTFKFVEKIITVISKSLRYTLTQLKW